jgi:DNA-binding NtrC family response regulator
MPENKILIVDDEDSVRFGIRDFLESKGYEVEEAVDCKGALEIFQMARPDVVVTDYLLPDGNALEILPRLKAIDPDVPVVVLTGHGTIDLAVRAIKEGAEQFLTKPVELPTLEVILKRLAENLRNRQRHLVSKTRARRSVDPFLGTSKPIRDLAEQARKVAAADSPVLIQGETGAGKGVLARWIHENGPRAEESFVDLNCAGLSKELLESELFGHEKGAFTGATSSKLGLFEVAHKGSIFLDEIGDVDITVQPKLLKAFEEKRFRRLGDVRDRRVDIRLIAATHQDLGLLVREKKFRSDLYFRISTIPLIVPSLRERVEDLPLIAQRLLDDLSSDIGRGALMLSPQAESALKTYNWPGNVRELRNVLERAALLSDEDVLDAGDLRFDARFGGETEGFETNLTLRDLERQYIEKVLKEEGGRVEEASIRLGIPRSSLYEKIKKYGITVSR